MSSPEHLHSPWKTRNTQANGLERRGADTAAEHGGNAANSPLTKQGIQQELDDWDIPAEIGVVGKAVCSEQELDIHIAFLGTA